VKECTAIAEREGRDLGTVMREKGALGEKQLEMVRAHLRKRSAEQAESAGAAAPPPLPKTPPGPVVSLEEMAQRDFGHVADKSIHELLREVRTCGVSDLHCQVGAPPFVRLHGSLVYLKHPPYERTELARKIDELFGPYERGVFETHWDVDFCLETEHGRYRTSVFKERLGTDCRVPGDPAAPADGRGVHLPDQIKRFTGYSQGIVLITGPAGSGKSATMAALVELINEERYDHIVTVEDPIEYIFESRNCQREPATGEDSHQQFRHGAQGRRCARPGCHRDRRNARPGDGVDRHHRGGDRTPGARHAAHDQCRAIGRRIIDVFPPKEQPQIRAMVSESMRGVISQQLIPRRDGLGREPALEIMFSSPAVANMIRESRTFQLTSVLQTGARQGMKLMDDSLQEL